MEASPASSTLKRNFILQQGFQEPPRETCAAQYSALHFQPRVVGLVVVIAVLLQSGPLFLALSAVLWWSALLPSSNPFDALHNLLLTARRGAVRLSPAPAPRRFSQGMAASFALAIGVLLLLGYRTAAYVLEGLMVVAVGGLVLGGFCLGSFVFHLLTRRGAFARQTLPWANPG